jgi:hypothetical protein
MFFEGGGEPSTKPCLLKKFFIAHESNFIFVQKKQRKSKKSHDLFGGTVNPKAFAFSKASAMAIPWEEFTLRNRFLTFFRKSLVNSL